MPYQKHQAFALPQKEIKRLVKELPINKLGPSMIPFAVTDKFLSPYKIFKKTRLIELSKFEEVKDLSLIEKSRKVAQEWSRMSVAEKKVYQNMMRECRGEYVKYMSGARIPFVRRRRGKSARDRTMPDPIATPFRAFIKENQALFEQENPGLDYYQIKDLLQDAWDVFDADQLAYYENLSKEDKWRYIEEWEAWLRYRFASDNPVQPHKFPQLPERPLTGYRIFCEMKKKQFLDMMPESQQHEVVGLVQREWNQLSLEDKQHYEEEATEDQLRHKKEMEAYHREFAGRVKKHDDISQQFIDKLRSLQSNPHTSNYEPPPPHSFMVGELLNLGIEGTDIYESIADQAVEQIMNLRKESKKLIKQSRKKQIEEAREQKRKEGELSGKKKAKKNKLVQRTLYSQVAEMKEKIDEDVRMRMCSYTSAPAALGKGGKKKFPKRGVDAFYEHFNNEEDYLLTHLSEIIAKNKKVQPPTENQQVGVQECSQVEKDIKQIVERITQQSQKTPVTTVSENNDKKKSDLNSMDDWFGLEEPATVASYQLPVLKDAKPLSSLHSSHRLLIAPTQIESEDQSVYDNFSAALEASQQMNDKDEDKRIELDFDDPFASQMDDDDVMILESSEMVC